MSDTPPTGAHAGTAHLLLQADPGRADEVAAHVGALPGVVLAAVTSGPYDVIAVVAPAADVGRAVRQARRAPGLARLRVCLPASEQAAQPALTR